MIEIEKITSRENRRLVRVRRIRDGYELSGVFAEGRRLLEEAVRSAVEIEECFVTRGFGDTKLLESIAGRTDKIAELPERIFHSIADTKQTQGIILIVKRPLSSQLEIESRLSIAMLPLIIYLKEINNPSNLGAILRTVEAAGAAGVIVSKNSADAFSPRAVRASMGACFRIPVWENVDFGEVALWAKSVNLRTTAADISATANYTQIDWRIPRLLIFGSEAHGLDGDEVTSVSDAIQIPMANGVESLNIAVSAGVILFEAKRQNS